MPFATIWKRTSRLLPPTRSIAAESAWFAERAYYLQGDFGDAGTYTRLAKKLQEVGAKHQAGANYLFYLATPPQVFAPIVDELGKAGLTKETEGSWRRVIVEKPFGTDLLPRRR